MLHLYQAVSGDATVYQIKVRAARENLAACCKKAQHKLRFEECNNGDYS